MVKKKRQSEPGDNCGESTESCEDGPKCAHIKKAVDLNKLKKKLKISGIAVECSDCAKSRDDDSSENKDENSMYEVQRPTLWMCLQCGSQLCGRNHKSHALQHHLTPHSDSHCLAVDTGYWEIYCYMCNTSIGLSGTTWKLEEAIDLVKKQAASTSKTNSVAETQLEIPEPPKITLMLDKTPPAIGSRAADCSPAQRVRGLSNLGNTCFFNSVLQCLVQTPYLTWVLREMAEPGEKFLLPGGACKVSASDSEGEERELQLPPIAGELQKWGPLTETLASALEKLQDPGKADTFNPKELFHAFTQKNQQFGTGEQHDSHELLRHLLEAVRGEDLRRYQSIVLQKLNLDSKEKRSDLDKEKIQKVKFYGQQASDTMLRPEQVFRGFLVSTLECQDCHHSSNRTEYFLDLSLPVTAEKPQPPAVTRRKGPAPEEQINCLGAPDENKPSKHQLKKERQAARKLRKNKKGHNNWSVSEKQNESSPPLDGTDSKTENKSSSEQSDADVEDNLEENPKRNHTDDPQPQPDTAAAFAYQMESGYNSDKLISSDSIRASPVDLDKEKSDLSPERLEKDKDDALPTTYLSAKAIALEYHPLSSVDSPVYSNPDSGVASPETAKHTLSDTVNVESPLTSKELGSPTSLSSEINMDMSSPRQTNNSPVYQLDRPVSRSSFVESENHVPSIILRSAMQRPMPNWSEFKIHSKMDCLKLDNPSKGAISKLPTSLTLNMESTLDPSEFRLTSRDLDSSKVHSQLMNRNPTVSPRYQCDDGEYSIQSCLNQFTASELLAGNNKVGCEACTKKANTGKTVYTNATKRFLISSPPAVLILHLKRFQFGPRCVFRKMAKHVNFSTILDLAPFCSEKVRSLPNVSPDQTKLLYSLYGVVEHSGSMHGGHYVAYVKVRSQAKPGDKRFSFLPKGENVSRDEADNTAPEVLNGTNDDTDSSMSGYESGEKASGTSQVEPPPGKWFYISDSRVVESSEDKVLKAQAYLLFYERIV